MQSIYSQERGIANQTGISSFVILFLEPLRRCTPPHSSQFMNFNCLFCENDKKVGVNLGETHFVADEDI